MYEQVARNRRRSILLVLLVLGLAAGIGYVFGLLFEWGAAGVVVALAIAGVMAFSSYRFGDRVVLRVSKARPATRESHPRLLNLVEGLCIASGLPMPRVYVVPEEAPNAFATGRNPENASIAVTEGLLQELDRLELEAVLAHELSHVKNRDILVGTLVATLVGVVVLLAEWLRRALFWGGGRTGRGRAGLPIAAVLVVGGLVLSILAPLGAQMIRFAVSRRREYLADADGSLMTRYPPGLASALRKIGAAPNRMRVTNNATAHLWFSQPSRAEGSGVSWFERMFSTHPPIEDRIRALEQM